MSWTRSAALRAGVTGAAGVALVLSILPPASQPPVAAAAASPADTVLAVASGELPIPTGPSADEVVAAEAARDRLAASRAQERAALAKQEKREAKRASRTQQRQAAPTPTSGASSTGSSSEVVGERYTTVALNVRTAPGGSVIITTLATGSTVAITDRTEGEWQQVRYDGADAWVNGQYLSTQQPVAAPAAPSGAACAYGSGIESGLGANARAVYRAVCAAFPQVTGYGGYRPDGGNHGSGRAVDIMASGQLGWDIANWVRANAGALGVSEVIHAQSIWTVQRGGEGWRGMSDRGSTTANHYDHVHVSTY